MLYLIILCIIAFVKQSVLISPLGFPHVSSFYFILLFAVCLRCMCCVLIMFLSLPMIPCVRYRSNLPNYCHSSSSGWPVSGCSRTAGDPGAAPLVITPQEAEKCMHTQWQPRTHTEWPPASMTGCLISSQEVIIKPEKLCWHQICIHSCAQSPWQKSCMRDLNAAL